MHDALAEQRAFCDQRQGWLFQQQAFVKRRDSDCQPVLAVDEIQPAVDGLGSQLEAFEQFQQHFPAPGGLGGEQHATGEVIQKIRQGRQWLSGLGFDGQVRQGLRREALASGTGVDILLAGDHARPVFQAREAVLYREKQLGWRQQRPGRVDAAFFIAVAHVVPEVLGSLFDARQGEHLSVLRQIIEQRRGFLEEQRDVVLDAGRRNAAAQVLENRAAPEVHVEAFAKARLEACDFLFLQREFTGGQQAYRLDLVDGALSVRVEGAQRFDLIIEQVDTKRQLAAHREQIDQRPAHGELAVFVDRVHIPVAAGFQTRTHGFHIELLANIQHQAAAEQEFGRRQSV